MAVLVDRRAKVAPQALRRSSVDSSIAQFSMGDRLRFFRAEGRKIRGADGAGKESLPGGRRAQGEIPLVDGIALQMTKEGVL